MREIGWKEAGEWRGFPILRMSVKDKDFLIEGEECKHQERLKMWKKSMPEQKCFSMGYVSLPGPNGRGGVGSSRKKFSGSEQTFWLREKQV